MIQYCVYILFSPDSVRTYVGQTEDVDRRVGQHNAGKVRSTKAYRPWTLFHVEFFGTRQQAKERELWFKTPAGRRRIAELLHQQAGLTEAS